MVVAVDDDAFGSMTIDYVNDYLMDFDCKIVADETDMALQKLNAFSTYYAVSNEDLLNGLIAYLKNCKKTTISDLLLDDYEHKVLKLKKKEQPQPRNHPLPLVVLERKQEEKIENIEFLVKTKFTGSSFAKSENRNSTFIGLPQHQILSDCNREFYLYGHGNIVSDIYEIMPWLSKEDQVETIDLTESEDISTSITGSIFPSDGAILTIENATLFTASNAFPLNLDKIDRISLFPGMTLTGKCTFDRGVCCVQSIVEPKNPLEMAKLGIGSTHYSSLKIFIAYGPFYGSDNNLGRYQKLINSAKIGHADALILIGPFLTNNDAEKMVEETPETLYSKFLSMLQTVNNTKMRIYLVPNCQTDLMAMPFFPTPPLFLPELDVLKQQENVTFLPDPAVFEFEGVQFAVSSSGILMHLWKQEIFKCKSSNVVHKDRMSRLISKLFSSRSLYPLYPADPDLSFSLQKSHQKIFLDKQPHVLILPSIILPIIKEVDGTLVINPGCFNDTGTFALLEIDLLSAVDWAALTPTRGTSISQFAECSIIALSSQ